MTEPPAPKKRPKPTHTWRTHPTWKEKTRSERWLRERGWTVDNVEYRLPGSFITKDLFGFGDLMAIRATLPHLIVQATSATNSAARETKIEKEPRAALWLRTGGAIHVHGWARPSPGGRRSEWALRIVCAVLNDLDGIEWRVIEEVDR